MKIIIYKYNIMEFDDHQKLINDYLKKYKESEGKSQDLWKKTKMHIDQYEIQLVDNYAAQPRFAWLNNIKDQLNAVKQQKTVVVDKIKIQDILQFGNDIDQRLISVHKNTHEAIKVSTYIRVQLDKQIEELDGLYDENKDFKKRVKKAQKGLRVIIRRAMLNRCTRFLCVLTVLGVIATIIIYILKDNGVIQSNGLTKN